MYLVAKFGGHGSYGNGNINSYINFYTSQKKLNSPPLSAILRDFQNQEYQFPILKPRIWMAEKQIEEKHMQLKSAMRFTQT